MRWRCDVFGWEVCLVALLALAGCATPSLDMSGGRIEPAGSDGGVVIGSVLVQAEQEPPNSWFNRLFGRKAAGFVYDFEIVKIDGHDPEGVHPYADRYELDVKPGEERIFVARLPIGTYLFKSFRHEGLSAMPRRVTMGVPFTYTVQDARDATLAAVHKQHPDVGQQAVDAPMQAR